MKTEVNNIQLKVLILILWTLLEPSIGEHIKMHQNFLFGGNQPCVTNGQINEEKLNEIPLTMKRETYLIDSPHIRLNKSETFPNSGCIFHQVWWPSSPNYRNNGQKTCEPDNSNQHLQTSHKNGIPNPYPYQPLWKSSLRDLNADEPFQALRTVYNLPFPSSCEEPKVETLLDRLQTRKMNSFIGNSKDCNNRMGEKLQEPKEFVIKHFNILKDSETKDSKAADTSHQSKEPGPHETPRDPKLSFDKPSKTETQNSPILNEGKATQLETLNHEVKHETFRDPAETKEVLVKVSNENDSRFVRNSHQDYEKHSQIMPKKSMIPPPEPLYFFNHKYPGSKSWQQVANEQFIALPYPYYIPQDFDPEKTVKTYFQPFKARAGYMTPVMKYTQTGRLCKQDLPDTRAMSPVPIPPKFHNQHATSPREKRQHFMDSAFMPAKPAQSIRQPMIYLLNCQSLSKSCDRF